MFYIKIVFNRFIILISSCIGNILRVKQFSRLF